MNPIKRTHEYSRRLDSAACILTDDESEHLPRPCSPYFNLHPFRSFLATYRNFTARLDESGVYAKAVCIKCGERIAEERQPDLDNSTTPICTLVNHYGQSLIDACVLRYCSDIPGACRVRMKSGHLFWAKYRLETEVVNLHGLSNDYCSPGKDGFTILSRYFQLTHSNLIEKGRGRCHWKG